MASCVDLGKHETLLLVSRDLNRQFLAKDAYREWKRRVRAAHEDVRVFSPYLDRLVVDLLGNARVDPSALSVVTDLSPKSGALDYRARLLSIRRLLQRGSRCDRLRACTRMFYWSTDA